MVSSKSKDRIIEDALNGVDFKIIFSFYQKMGIEYPYSLKGKELSPEIISIDLRKILNTVLTEIKWETQDNHWLVYYDPHSIEDTALHIQIFFTPFSTNVYQFKDNMNHKEKLESKLSDAVNQEKYELASKIHKQLEEILNKKRKKINGK